MRIGNPPILFFVLGVAISLRAEAQTCAPGMPNGSGYSNMTTVRIVDNTGQSFLAGPIGDGASLWNNSCGGMSGVEYPRLSLSFGSASITMAFASGHSPRMLCGGGSEYCAAEYDGAGTITFYQQFGSPGQLHSLSSISSVSLGRLVAHEIGHALGLDEGSCTNGIMTTPVDGSSVITGEECQTADSENLVPNETTTGGDVKPLKPGCEPYSCTPVVVDLDGGGFRFTNLDDAVAFDLDADGEVERISWTAATSREALLALDRNGNGRIDDGRELFGSVTSQPPSRDPNGFAALAVFDDPALGGDGDGWLTDADSVFPQLRLWIDHDHNGISQIWELSSLADEKIRAIEVAPVVSNRRDRYGNRMRWLSHVQFSEPNVRRLAATDVIFLSE